MVHRRFDPQVLRFHQPDRVNQRDKRHRGPAAAFAVGGRQRLERRKQQMFLLGEVSLDLIGQVGECDAHLPQCWTGRLRTKRRQLDANRGHVAVQRRMVPLDDVGAENIQR